MAITTEFALGLFALIFFGMIIVIYNNLVRLRKQIDQSWANIDVLLKQRFDEVPRLIEITKGYMKYERGLLNEITKARTAWARTQTLKQKAVVNDVISGELKTLFAVAEDYPKLEANKQFVHLQERITGLENEIADRREFYNDAVGNYNIRIHSIPDVLLAKILGYMDKEFFKATPEETEVIKVELGLGKVK